MTESASSSLASSAAPAAAPRSSPSRNPPMVRVDGLTLHFGDRPALVGLSMEVERGELFALLGPNGSGKSTLLRILSTLLEPTEGRAEVDGLELMAEPAAVRHRLGVVFQAPSLDGKLTVQENLRFQGYLYGLRGRPLSTRIGELLERFALADRRRDWVETLSGGLKRRVELAKALLHRPALLLLDEPSTGLDLAARQSFWKVLADLREERELTIMVATHLLDEADRCSRVALLDQGRLVALDRPEALKAELGDTVVTVRTRDPAALAPRLAETMGLRAQVLDGRLRLTDREAVALAPQLMTAYAAEVDSIHLGRPTLEDVFLARTGRAITPEDTDPEEAP